MVLTNSIYGIGLAILLGGPVHISSSFAQGECEPHKRELKAVYKSFSETVDIVPLIAETDSSPGSEYLYPGDCLYQITEQEEIRGYLLSTRAKGRYDYFDYGVIFSHDATVQQVIVTAYRSTYGEAICQKNWLRQFEAYRGGQLELGPDIDAVSGATLSATSLVKDIQRAYLLVSSQIVE